MQLAVADSWALGIPEISPRTTVEQNIAFRQRKLAQFEHNWQALLESGARGPSHASVLVNIHLYNVGLLDNILVHIYCSNSTTYYIL